MDSPDAGNTQPNEAELRAELARISQKLYTTEDPDIRTALQARVAELQSTLGIDLAKIAGTEMPVAQPVSKGLGSPKEKGKAEKTSMADLQALLLTQSEKARKQAAAQAVADLDIDIEADVEPSTPEQIEAADKLIQQARVETLRSNKVRARELLEEAAKAAPNSSTVLEMLADDYAERGQLPKAIAVYKRAVRIDAKNVNAERKLATLVLKLDSAGSLDDQMRRNLGDGAESMASHKAALVLTIFLPGLGHLVTGRMVKGWTLFGIWLLCVALLVVFGGDVARFFAQFSGKVHGNWFIAIPMVTVIGVYIAALMDFKKPQQESVRKPVERPVPPVNLPFE